MWRECTRFDGKLLVQRYLRQVLDAEGDTVHALLARMLNIQLEAGMRKREAEILTLGSRIGGIESLMSPIRGELSKGLAEMVAANNKGLVAAPEIKKSIFPDWSGDYFPPDKAPDLLAGVDTATKFLSSISPFSSTPASPDAPKATTGAARLDGERGRQASFERGGARRCAASPSGATSASDSITDNTVEATSNTRTRPQGPALGGGVLGRVLEQSNIAIP